MDVRVTGHQVDIGESLRDQAVGRMENITDKYFSRAVARQRDLRPGPAQRFHLRHRRSRSQGVVLKAHHRAQESHIAFEAPPTRSRSSFGATPSDLREHKGDGADDLCRECRLHGLRSQPEPARRARTSRRTSGDRRRNAGRHSRGERVRRGHAHGPSQHECADVQEQRVGRRST